MIEVNDELLDKRKRLAGSYLEFVKTFYRLRTNRLFRLSEPIGRESHYISIARELVAVLDGKTTRLIINVPPRYGKSEMLIHFIAWGLALYPDSNSLYVSYNLDLAMKQTSTIRSIMLMRQYRDIFGVELSEDTRSKANFETTRGGSVYAAGAGGTITGRGAGIRGITNRYSGCIVIDDIHKPDEVLSDTSREGVIDWYYNTMISRTNNANTPIIFLGQRVHESDLAGHLIKSGGWKVLSIPAIDGAGNALHPEMHTIDMLKEFEAKRPYEFAAQYQQNPQPAGGGIFKPEWFFIHNEMPEIIATFITADTAETSKSYNDASVFSFWGLHKINVAGTDTDEYGLVWIDCIECRVEPKDLQDIFLEFYTKARRFHVKPDLIAIEKKSTGSTLLSVLNQYQGMRVKNIERTKASGNKTARFLEMQPYIASKMIGFIKGAIHYDMCIEHMRKITANDSHAHDDIADTCYDAVKLALIDKSINIITRNSQSNPKDREIARKIMQNFKRSLDIRKKREF